MASVNVSIKHVSVEDNRLENFTVKIRKTNYYNYDGNIQARTISHTYPSICFKFRKLGEVVWYYF